MKSKALNIIISVFLFFDIALFGALVIGAFNLPYLGGHTYWSDDHKTVASSDEKVVLDIYDESVYVHHEPDHYHYTVDRNGKTYMSFSSENYDVEIKDDSVILEYEHSHNLKFKVS